MKFLSCVSQSSESNSSNFGNKENQRASGFSPSFAGSYQQQRKDPINDRFKESQPLNSYIIKTNQINCSEVTNESGKIQGDALNHQISTHFAPERSLMNRDDWLDPNKGNKTTLNASDERNNNTDNKIDTSLGSDESTGTDRTAITVLNSDVLSKFISDSNFIIPNPKLLKFKTKVSFEVKLVAVSPSDFWIRFHELSFDSLVTQMTNFYSKSCANSFVVPKETIKAGLLVAANVNGNFYRAEVIEDSSQYVDILFVDVGTSGLIAQSDIHLLHKAFAVPAFALRARLAGVFPTDENDWSEDAKKIFHDEIKDKTLNATIRAHNRETDVLDVEISSLSEFLIASGFAKAAKAAIKGNWFAVPATAF